MLHILSFGFSFLSSCVWVPQVCTDSRELSKENPSGNFPGGPKSLPFNAGVTSLISGHGSKILHASGQLNWQFPTREACVLQWRLNTAKKREKLCAGGFFVADVPRLSRPVDSRSWQRSNPDSDWEQWMLYHVGDSQHTQNIQMEHSESFAPGLVMFDVWAPYKLNAKKKKKNLLDHISTCSYLLKQWKCSIFKTDCDSR